MTRPRVGEFEVAIRDNSYIEFFQVNFSPDGHISNPKATTIKIQVALITAFIIWCEIWWIIKSKAIAKSLSEISKYIKSVYLFIILLFISFYAASYLHYQFLYEEDGFFESLTAVLAIASSLLMLVSVCRTKNHNGTIIKLILSVLFFLFGMEEISWGQRIFGWETPTFLATRSLQNETNIHNVFNEYLYYMYIVFNQSLGLFLFNSEWLRIRADSLLKIKKFVNIIPSSEFKLFGLFFMFLAVQSAVQPNFDGELTEEIFSIFCFTYALSQVFPTFSNNNNSI